MTDRRDWPVELEIEFESGDIECACGNVVHMYWNGGELDQKLCDCGRYYQTEHRETVLIIRKENK